MSREGQLMKNTIIITIGKICTQFISFFLLPLYTSLLSTEEYGVVDVLNTYVSLFIPIVTFQIEQAVFRFLIDIRENEYEKKKIISTSIFFVMLTGIIFLFIYLLFGKYINVQYKYFLLSNLLACMFSSLFLQISRGDGDNKTYAIGSLLTAVVTVVFNVILIAIFRKGAYGLLISTLLANVICSIYIILKKKLYKCISIKYCETECLKKLLKYSTPLIPNNLSWWTINAFDRTIITSRLGAGLNGIYSVANKFSGLYITVYNIFNMTWTESASLCINDNDKDNFFSKIVNTALKLFVAICLLIISIMPFVFPLMINGKFEEAYNQIPILMLSTLFNVVVGLISTVYIAKKMTNKVAKTSIIAAIINIIINVMLIDKIGLYAASISTAISYFVMMIFRYYDVQKYIKIKIQKSLMIGTLLMSILLFITYYRNNLYINIIALLITIIYSIVINKRNIINLLSFLKIKLKIDK